MTSGLKKALVAIAALAMPSSAWAACTVSNTGPTTLGTYSSAALQKSAVPYGQVPGGFDCADALLSVLSANNLSVTPTSTQGFKLKSTTSADTVNYVLAADSAGTTPIPPNAKFVYMNGGLINLLGLLGGSTRNVQVYVKPAAPSPTTTIPPGTYTGSFQLAWEWKLCSVVVTVVCVNTTQSTAPVTANVAVTMIVAPRPVGIVITTRTTYDPVSAGNPRAIPGSRQRSTITLTNTDIVAIDADSLNVVLPTPNRGSVALDGDGSASTAFVTTAEGSPASSLAVTYTAPASTTDDVDFSANGGTSWTYDPTSAPKSVTTVRIRPRGTMAAGSSFSVSLPYVLF